MLEQSRVQTIAMAGNDDVDGVLLQPPDGVGPAAKIRVRRILAAFGVLIAVRFSHLGRVLDVRGVA